MNNALLSTGFQRREGDAKGPAETGMGYHWEWHIPLTTLDQIGKHFIKACYSTICQLYLKIKRLQVEPLQAVDGIIIKQSDSNTTEIHQKPTIIFNRLWISHTGE